VGVLEISAWNQANALRQVTVKRGLDVRDFALTTFGGSGSLLLCRLMDVLGVPTVLVPPDPGNVSAFGLLTVDVKNDYVQTRVSLDEAVDPAALATSYDELRGQARDALLREGFPEDAHVFVRTADLRYFGQAFEVRVPVAEGPLDRAALDGVVAGFHAAHRGLYGYDFADDATQQVEWVNLRVSGIGPITRPERGRLAPAAPGGATGARGEASLLASPIRPVCFDADERYVDTPIHQRTDLMAGSVVEGPAIIEEYGSTVPLHPGFAATVDDFGNLLVRRQS
jgi:N-methylhydantoinase A